jgi:hypothetical protein
MLNPLWKLRIPMPACEGWQDVPMPSARRHEEGYGLGFWNRYMNPSKLAEIHATVLTAVTMQEGKVEESNTKAKEQAKVDSASNPGFVRA